MITYNQWLDYFLLDENGEPVNGDDGQPIPIGKEYYFDITISQFNLDVASSTGIDPQDLEEMYKLIEKDNLVLGSRFIGTKKRNNIYFRTFFANKVMSFFFSILNNKKITDVATCYKMMPSLYFINTNFVEKGFSIEIEIMSKFLKFSKNIIEVPISYSGRSYEEGKKIKTIDGFQYIYNTIKYRFFV